MKNRSVGDSVRHHILIISLRRLKLLRNKDRNADANSLNGEKTVKEYYPLK